MLIPYPKQLKSGFTSFFKSGVAIPLLTFVIGVAVGAAIPAVEESLNTGVTDGDFSSSPATHLMCKPAESAKALLEQRNFVESEWAGSSSLGGQTRVWMRKTTAGYLIVRTDDEGMTCFLDTGQF